MSYIAKIYDHLEINNFEDLKQAIINHIKKNKLKSSMPNLEEKLQEIKLDPNYNETQPITLLLLKKPRLLFNPPIEKSKLMGGAGWLAKNYYEFEELFEAAGL